MQAGLLSSQFFDQHLDPIDRELIRDRRRYSFVMLDFFIELDALVTHWGQFRLSKGDQPKRSRLVRAHRHCRTLPPRHGRAARPATGSQRPSFNEFHSNRALASPAFGGCSFFRDGRDERHSAVQRSP